MYPITDQKQIKKLSIIFTVVYVISYITRINYGAIISEMEVTTGFSKALLSMAVTGSFITYGAGQIISGMCGDLFSPKKLMTCGLIVTGFMNLAMSLYNDPYYMLVVWCINGFAQAFMWPPLVKIMTSLFNEEDYKDVTVKVIWGSSIGTIFVYLISPLLISLFNYKAVFLFSSLCAFVMIVFWEKFCPDVMVRRNKQIIETQKKSHFSFFSLPIPLLLTTIVLHGMLRDGITTWMPSLISETYQIDSSIAILTSVILPIFSIVCNKMTAIVHKKWFKNPIVCASVVYAIGSLSSLSLIVFSKSQPIISILSAALLTGCMHGVNLILICMLPAYFKSTGKVSTISGVFNSCVYVGSALSTYGIAVMIEAFNWNVVLMIWAIVAFLGTLICVLCIRPWKTMSASL